MKRPKKRRRIKRWGALYSVREISDASGFTVDRTREILEGKDGLHRIGDRFFAGRSTLRLVFGPLYADVVARLEQNREDA